eukprot:scaffold53201_cov78-Phaeocystis_antarctica.AAC.1
MPSVMLRITVRYSTCCVVCRGGPSTIVTALCPRVTPLNTSDRTHAVARPHTVSSPIHSRHPPRSQPSPRACLPAVYLFNSFQFSSVQFLPRSTSQSAEPDSEAGSAPARRGRAGGPVAKRLCSNSPALHVTMVRDNYPTDAVQLSVGGAL